MASKEKHYNISEVIQLTGATEFLLRTWENRYNIVHPKRTSTGRRLYSSQDVIKISKIVYLTRDGHKISRLANLTLPALLDLEMEHQKNIKAEPEGKLPSPVKKVYDHLSRLDWTKIDSIFKDQLYELKKEEYLNHFLIPITQEMSLRSVEGKMDIIQEHILSSLLKEYLYVLGKNNLPIKKKQKIKILYATSEGDYHDLGLLICKVAAEIRGINCMYLGSHVPKKDLVEACLRLKPTHVVLGTSVNAQNTVEENILKYVHFLDQHIPQNINLWMGGYAAQGLSLQLSRPCKIFKNLSEYDTEILKLVERKG